MKLPHARLMPDQGKHVWVYRPLLMSQGGVALTNMNLGLLGKKKGRKTVLKYQRVGETRHHCTLECRSVSI